MIARHSSRRSATGRSLSVATDHAPHARHEKEVPFGRAVRRHRARDGVRGALHQPRRAGLLSWRPCSSGCRLSGTRLRARRPEGRGRRPGEPRAARHAGGLAGDRGRLRVPLAELLADRTEASRPSARDDPAGGWCTSRERLPAARGRDCLQRGVGRGGRLRVRRGGLHDRDDRLPGGRHRSELRGPDRLLHGRDGRQLRRRHGALGVGARTRGRLSCARRAGRRGRTGCYDRGVVASGIDTRSSSCTCARRGACGRSRWRARPRWRRRSRACGHSPRWPAERSRRRSRRESRTCSRTRVDADRGRRLRLQALDPEPARLGGCRHGLPARRRPGRARPLRRRPALERPRRPGALKTSK